MKALSITEETSTCTKIHTTQLTFLITVNGKLLKESAKSTGIDSALQKQIVSKFTMVGNFVYIYISQIMISVGFFLAEYILSFHGDSSTISDPE